MGLVWLPTQTVLTDIFSLFLCVFSQHPQRNLQSSEGLAASSASAEPQGPPGLWYAVPSTRLSLSNLQGTWNSTAVNS